MKGKRSAANPSRQTDKHNSGEPPERGYGYQLEIKSTVTDYVPPLKNETSGLIQVITGEIFPVYQTGTRSGLAPGFDKIDESHLFIHNTLSGIVEAVLSRTISYRV